MVILERRSYFVPSTSFQSTKPSSSFSQSRKSRKLDFENVIYLLELEPEDSGCNLLSALTNNGKLSVVSFTSLSRSELKEIRVAGANQTTLAFDDWEITEILYIYSYFVHKRSNDENFQLRDIEPGPFEDFKWRSAYYKMASAQESTPRSSTTRGQLNSSRPSIHPAHVASTSSPSQATTIAMPPPRLSIPTKPSSATSNSSKFRSNKFDEDDGNVLHPSSDATNGEERNNIALDLHQKLDKKGNQNQFFSSIASAGCTASSLMTEETFCDNFRITSTNLMHLQRIVENATVSMLIFHFDSNYSKMNSLLTTFNLPRLRGDVVVNLLD